MSNVNTPHIVPQGEFAKTVLMPGDPLRSEFIAKNFLSDARLVNDVRGVHGYTGSYNGKPVSVMASGMGMPSIGIYSHELFELFGVDRIIRVGSAGGIADGVSLRDVILAEGACTTSSFASGFGVDGSFAPIASFSLLCSAASSAERMGIRYKVGNVLSTDVFYDETNALAVWKKMGVLAVEMEAAALYMNAARFGKEALCICTVSDLPLEGASSSALERQTSFTDMIELALNLI